jgi:hypothetical protein
MLIDLNAVDFRDSDYWRSVGSRRHKNFRVEAEKKKTGT